MNNNEFQKDWKRFLIEIEKSGTQLAKEFGQTQQGFNRKIREGTIKYLELSDIVEKYGYSISIHKAASKEISNKELIEALETQEETVPTAEEVNAEKEILRKLKLKKRDMKRVKTNE